MFQNSSLVTIFDSSSLVRANGMAHLPPIWTEQDRTKSPFLPNGRRGPRRRRSGGAGVGRLAIITGGDKWNSTAGLLANRVYKPFSLSVGFLLQDLMWLHFLHDSDCLPEIGIELPKGAVH
jgi:hypothetical protein